MDDDRLTVRRDVRRVTPRPPAAHHFPHQPGEPVRPQPTSTPCFRTSTRSTSSCTIRAFSAGKSSSHSGSSCASASRASSSVMSSRSTRAARHVPTMISGCRKMPRNWSMTAASISAHALVLRLLSKGGNARAILLRMLLLAAPNPGSAGVGAAPFKHIGARPMPIYRDCRPTAG